MLDWTDLILEKIWQYLPWKQRWSLSQELDENLFPLTDRNYRQLEEYNKFWHVDKPNFEQFVGMIRPDHAMVYQIWQSYLSTLSTSELKSIVNFTNLDSFRNQPEIPNQTRYLSFSDRGNIQLTPMPACAPNEHWLSFQLVHQSNSSKQMTEDLAQIKMITIMTNGIYAMTHIPGAVLQLKYEQLKTGGSRDDTENKNESQKAITVADNLFEPTRPYYWPLNYSQFVEVTVELRDPINKSTIMDKWQGKLIYREFDQSLCDSLIPPENATRAVSQWNTPLESKKVGTHFSYRLNNRLPILGLLITCPKEVALTTLSLGLIDRQTISVPGWLLTDSLIKESKAGQNNYYWWSFNDRQFGLEMCQPKEDLGKALYGFGEEVSLEINADQDISVDDLGIYSLALNWQQFRCNKTTLTFFELMGKF